jgi:hypothetical protein
MHISRLFEIRETTNGRFHISKFGADIGGSKRDIPLRFVVISKNGTILLESESCTAKELKIAENSRVDYNNNLYHYTDVVSWNSGNLQAETPLGKRIPWKVPQKTQKRELSNIAPKK